MTHICGTCTLCCELVSVGEIEKPSFALCKHQRNLWSTNGPGCAIYERRPYSCRAWSCLWLRSEDWSDDYRPDRCGFVVDEMLDLATINGEEQPSAQIWVRRGAEEAYREQLAINLIATLIDKGLAVIWRTADGMARIFVKAGDGISCSEPIPPSGDEDYAARTERLSRLNTVKRLHAAGVLSDR